MIVRFFDLQDETNPLHLASIKDDGQLVRDLDGLRSRPPFMCELVGENAYKLLIGVGRDLGCTQYSAVGGDPPYLMAVAPNAGLRPEEYVEFLCGATPTPVPRQFVLPFGLIKDIAVHFRQTGERSPAVSWEEL